MRRTSIAWTAGLIVVTGFAGASAAQTPHGGHGASHAAMPGDAASTRDFKNADFAMMKAMALPYTGDPDVDFRTHMIPHHQGAIAMARVAVMHAKDQSSRDLAETIIRDQEREIADMRAWLTARGR